MPRHGPPGDPHGLFGAPAPRPSLGLFDRVLGGEADPRLSQAANEEAAKQARLQAGLAMLLGSVSGPGMEAPGLAQVLAQGLATGHQAGGMARSGLVAQQALQQGIASQPGLSPQQRQIIASLPMEQQIEVLKELATAVTDPKVVGDALVNPATGEVIYQGPDAQRLPTEMYPIISSLGKTPETMTPKDWAQALLMYENLRRSGGQNINIDTGTIPPGYRAVRDENGRVVQMIPIEGGPAERAIEGERRSLEAGSEMTIRAARTVVQDVDRALELIADNPSFTTGLAGAASRGIPGTPAHRVDQHIKSINGNIGIDSLLRIKASGAGLGHIPQSQLEMLAGLLGRLDTAMNVNDLWFNLERIKQIYQDIIQSTIERGTEADLRIFGIDPSEVRNQVKAPWEQ